MKPINQTYLPSLCQKGVSLIEVLMALVILAVAALGYSALQASSLASVDESMMRMQAQLILRESAERIRANANLENVMAKYQTEFKAKTLPTLTDCLSIMRCSSTQIVRNDVTALRTHADSKGIKLGMVTCPNTEMNGRTKCLVAAWNETIPAYANDAESSSQGSSFAAQQQNNGDIKMGCFNTNGGYLAAADCLYLEVY